MLSVNTAGLKNPNEAIELSSNFRAADISGSNSNNSSSHFSSFFQRIWRRAEPNDSQRYILLLFGVATILIFIMSQWYLTNLILYPFSILATIFHEFGHALMTLLTGGKVLKIVISEDESGSTHFVGGVPCLITPAGYMGSTLVGSFLIFM